MGESKPDFNSSNSLYLSLIPEKLQQKNPPDHLLNLSFIKVADYSFFMLLKAF